MTNDPHNRSDALHGTTAASLERLFRRIAPADLGGHSVYVLLSSELDPAQRPPAYAWGLTGAVLDLSLKNWLVSQSRWSGRGPAVILNDLTIRRDALELAGGDESFASELYRDRMVATGLHELAHVLSRPSDLKIPPMEIESEVLSSAEAALSNYGKVTEAEVDEAEAELPPWFGGHDAMFVRVLVHILSRVETITGQRIVTSLAFPGSRYELSLLEHYRRSLQKEISGFESWLTFDDLRKCDPPKAFCELWRSDCWVWWKGTRDPDASLDYYLAALRPYLSVLKAD